MSQDIKRVTLGDVMLAVANLELGLRWLHDRAHEHYRRRWEPDPGRYA